MLGEMSIKMKKLIVCIFLLFMGTVAHAGWVEISNNPLGDAYFIDPTTKKRFGNVVQLWTMHNHVSRRYLVAKPYLSSKAFYQFNCNQNTSRITSMTWYSGNMGTGAIVVSENTPNEPWEPVPPGTVRQSTLNYACR